MPVKYLGMLVEVIYEDQSGKIMKRRTQIKSIRYWDDQSRWFVV
ncbi:hypothetical protein QUF95_07290 [Paenibacillus silvae]|nr:hypothetical protein [Paenibacillus silvae]MDM5277180.1 hypothetical protein [Paenibacillus silvae]